MQIQKLLRYITVGGLFLAPFSVLLIADSLFFPFITGKAFFYRSLVEIVACAWLILTLVHPDYRPYRQKIYYVLFGILAVLFVANMASTFPYKAFWSNFERMDGWITLLHHVLFFVVLSSVFTTYNLWKKFWNISLAVSVIVCLYGVLQYFGVLTAIQGGDRADGTFGNAAYLAVYNLFHIFLALFLFVRSRGTGLRWLYAFVGLFNLFNLYATATRGALLGLGVGAVVTALLVLFTQKENRTLRYAAGGLVCFVVLFAILLFALKDSQFVKNNTTLSRMASISLEEGAPRFAVWSMALTGVKEKPIIGWGQEGFSEVFAKHYTPDMWSQEPWFDRAHNVVIDWLIAGGIVGLLLYFSVLYFGLSYLWKSEWLDSTEKSIFTGLCAGYFFQNLFVFDNLGSYLLFFATLAFFTAGARGEEKHVGGEQPVSGGLLAGARVAILIVLIFVLYSANIKPISAGQDLIQALTPSTSPEAILASYTEALDKDTFATPEIVEQMMIQAPGYIAATTISNESKQQFVERAVSAVERELARRPDEVRLLYAAGVFYNRIGQVDTSIALLEHAREISPNKQIILFELAFAYIVSGEEEKGIALLEEIYALAPEFEEAEKMYALGAIYTGARALEAELVASLPENFLYTDNRVIQAYANTKRVSDLLRIWQWRVEHEPQNVQNHVSLAAAYLELGREAEAINALNKAIEIEPRFKEQGEQFIQNIRSGAL